MPLENGQRMLHEIGVRIVEGDHHATLGHIAFAAHVCSPVVGNDCSVTHCRHRSYLPCKRLRQNGETLARFFAQRTDMMVQENSDRAVHRHQSSSPSELASRRRARVNDRSFRSSRIPGIATAA